MTSLAHQLKRLALPQSDGDLLTGRQVASLLFDPKDAATMDRHTFYALGESTGVRGQRHTLLLELYDHILPLSSCLSSSLSSLHQAAQGWRSCLELNLRSWSSRTLCSAERPLLWSAVSSQETSIRSWTPTSHSSSPACVRTSSSNRRTSALSGWFTGTLQPRSCQSKRTNPNQVLN